MDVKKVKKKGVLNKVAMGVVFLLVVVQGHFVYGQSDPYDPSSPTYIGKSKVKKPMFTGILSSTAFDSLDAYDDQGIYYEGFLGFDITQKIKGGFTLGYSHPFDLQAESTYRWEFEDLNFRAVLPSYWVSKSKAQRVNLIGSISAPTSGTSINATMLFSSSFTVQYSYSYQKFTFTLTPGVVLAYHEYGSADEDGFIKNSPFGVNLGASIRYQALQKLGLVAGLSIYDYIDYDFYNYTVQSLRASADYALTKEMYLSAGIRWRDRTLTNNSLFDDDAVISFLNLSYSL